MNRDEGQYFLPHTFDEILIKKHQIDKSTGNTKNMARRQSSVSSEWWLRQQLIAETYTISAHFGSEFENYCLSCYSTDPDESIYRCFDEDFIKIQDWLTVLFIFLTIKLMQVYGKFPWILCGKLKSFM